MRQVTRDRCVFKLSKRLGESWEVVGFFISRSGWSMSVVIASELGLELGLDDAEDG